MGVDSGGRVKFRLNSSQVLSSQSSLIHSGVQLYSNPL